MTTKPPDLQQKLKAMLSQSTPLLPAEELCAFVEYYFGQRDRYLQILAQHPAPLYLQESAVLTARALQLQKAFQNFLPSVAFYYAVKSNNHPDLARILLEAEFRAGCFQRA